MEYPKYTGSEPCAQIGGDWFFSDYEEGRQIDYRVVRAACASCEMLEPCREYALHHSVAGFWGGMSERQRQEFRRRNNIVPIPMFESA